MTAPWSGRSAAPQQDPFWRRCLSLDLEVGKADGLIQAFGAVRGDTGQSFVHSGGGLAPALEQLDDLAAGASFLLGHNLIAFDRPHLAVANPGLQLLKLPVVDTLRLSPLAFPRNPYHALVKHYQDGGLKREQINDPELDARLTLKLLEDQVQALGKAAPELLTAWHWLTTPKPNGVDQALDALFSRLRCTSRPTAAAGRQVIGSFFTGRVCITQGRKLLAEAPQRGWDLSFALAWLSVAGENSVMPPWVRHQFPEAGQMVRRLRDTACNDPACSWSRERHDAGKELKRWFGFERFRPEPADDWGYPLQQSLVECAMAGRHVLGILPTGSGKSLCYQLPALSRYYNTGALTVVISPLVALMADQVAGLEARGIGCCFTVNGLLSVPERADVLDKVRLGDAGILLISPEQLRSQALRQALDQREIGAWVVDEAHCLGYWGHDFRPDYRYLGRFIREKAGREAQPVPPLTCLTATAKPDVVTEILQYFRKNLDVGLELFDGGARRTNLAFVVMRTTGAAKFAHVGDILKEYLPPAVPGGAIVYCATRRESEEVPSRSKPGGWR